MKTTDPITDYLGEIAWRLRWRRVSEAVVMEQLAKVRAAALESGSSPVEIFGAPAIYADSIPQGRSRSAGYWVATVVFVAALAVVGITAVNSLILHQEAGLWAVAIKLLACAGAAALGFIVGAAIDRRLPKDLDRLAPRS